MDPGNFFNSLIGNVERTILDPSTLVTDNLKKINHSLADASKEITSAIGENLQNISGSDKKGVRGFLDATINNINPMMMMVAGLGAAAVLIIALKV